MEKPEKPDSIFKSPDLPHDIQQEILTWLPGQSLVKFQATCKLWNSWMHDPAFAKKHFGRGGRHYRCIIYLHYFQQGVCHIETVDGSTQPHHKLLIDLQSLPEPMRFNYEISDSCNGIVCIYGYNNIVLYNPLTKETVLLPEPSSLISGDDKCYEDVYIGFIPSMDEYKIVYIYSNNLTLGHFAVFSLSSWSWNKITDIIIPILIRPILANGLMFWHSDSDTSVFWFDLATEQSGTIDLPSDVILPLSEGWHSNTISLSEVEGSLFFMNSHEDKDYISISIWKLQDVARGIWMRRTSICNPIFVPVDSCFLGDVVLDQGRAPFSLWNMIFYAPILGDSKKFYYLDRYDKRFGQNYFNMRLLRSLHVHSLVSLKKYVPSNCGNC